MKRDHFKTSYLDYYKDVLRRVSFCSVLFRKEYGKALKAIHATDLSDFDEWILRNHSAHLGNISQ